MLKSLIRRSLPMNRWFQGLFGFTESSFQGKGPLEAGWHATKANFELLEADGAAVGDLDDVRVRPPSLQTSAGLRLRSKANGRTFGVGHLWTPSLSELER